MASDLRLHCLLIYHKKDARLIWVKIFKLQINSLNPAEERLDLCPHIFAFITADV